jgi:predicted RNase H-like nuclease (RuvC/YqgF family)
MANNLAKYSRRCFKDTTNFFLQTNLLEIILKTKRNTVKATVIHRPSIMAPPEVDRISRSRAKKGSPPTIATTSSNTKKPTIDDLLIEMKELKNNFQALSSKNAELSLENNKLKTEMSSIYKDMDFLHDKIN